MKERMDAVLQWVASTTDLSNADDRANMVVRLVHFFGDTNVVREYLGLTEVPTRLAFQLARAVIDDELLHYK